MKTRYYLKRIMPETMKLIESTKIKVPKDDNCKNVPHLEITEVVLFHCKIFNNNFQQDSRVLYTLVSNKLLG